MTDHGGAPRTEAGKRLRRWVLNETGSARKGAWSDKLDDLILAIEAEAAQETPAPEGLRAALLALCDAWAGGGWSGDYPAMERAYEAALAAAPPTPAAPPRPEAEPDRCADCGEAYHLPGCDRAEPRPPEGLDAPSDPIEAAQEAPAPEGLADRVEAEVLPLIVGTESEVRAGLAVLRLVRAALAATPPTPAEPPHQPGAWAIHRDNSRDRHPSECEHGLAWEHCFRAEARPPAPATKAEIAAGLAQIAAGETPAYIRGYNAGFDEGWEQRAEARPPEGLEAAITRIERGLDRHGGHVPGHVCVECGDDRPWKSVVRDILAAEYARLSAGGATKP